MLPKLILELENNYGNVESTVKFKSCGTPLSKDAFGYKFVTENKEIYYNVEIEEFDYCKSHYKFTSFTIYKKDDKYYYDYNERIHSSPSPDKRCLITKDSFKEIINTVKNSFNNYFDIFF